MPGTRRGTVLVTGVGRRRSIGAWRRYAEFLEPLGQALGVDIRARLADA